MRLLVLAVAVTIMALALRPPVTHPPIADPICVTVGPVDVMGQQVVPYVHQCVPGQ